MSYPPGMTQRHHDMVFGYDEDERQERMAEEAEEREWYEELAEIGRQEASRLFSVEAETSRKDAAAALIESLKLAIKSEAEYIESMRQMEADFYWRIGCGWIPGQPWQPPYAIDGDREHLELGGEG